MLKVSDLLRIKGGDIWFVTPQSTVLEALRKMADKDVGALLVIENEEIKGIVSERDFARMIASIGECQTTGPVEAFMTKDVITVASNQSVADCMRLMTENRIRHLPVVDQGKLVGLISIGDVVRETINSQESLINSLENYIEGVGYGQ